ncbi:MAG: hypothetical protein U0840_19035 [Gemmataceae bacterium]
MNAELFKAINQGDVVVRYWQQWSRFSPDARSGEAQEIDGRLKEGKAVLFGVDMPGWKSNLSQKQQLHGSAYEQDAAGTWSR